MTAGAGRGAMVFGATGFIGRWVAGELARRGFEVTAVIRDPAQAAAVFTTVGIAPALEVVDLECPGAAAEILRRRHPALVFNLAGYGIDRGETDEARANRLNHELVAELVAACAGATNAILVHVGSAAEYGAQSGVLVEDGPVAPSGVYGTSKLAGTTALVDGARRAGCRAVCARLFTVFGQGEHEGRLLPQLRQAARGEGIVPLSAGTQERDFAWVGDVAPALVDLAAARWTPGTVVNIASGRARSVRSFVLAAARALGIAESRLGFGAVASLPNDTAGFSVSVARMRALLGRTLPSDLDAMLASAVREEP